MPAQGPPTPSSSRDIDRRTDRRKFLASAGTLAIALAAGCFSSSDDEESQPSEATPTRTPETTITRTPESTSTPTPEPTPTQTETETEETTPAEAEQAAEVFAEYATPLETVEPSAPRDDLDFLADTLADRSVIGMGEATHGTREFFQFKDRLFRFLVEELGVRIFAWEGSFAASLPIDRYVRMGAADAEPPMRHVNLWPWDVESVQEMLAWMHEFNDGREPEDRIRFYGVDMQFTDSEIRELRLFFDDVDDDFLEDYEDAVSALRANRPALEGRSFDTVRSFVSAVRDHVEANEDEFVAATSRRDYDFARQHVRVLDQNIEFATALHQGNSVKMTNVRNRAMAENTRWVLEHEESDQLALYMHNGHVRRTTERFEEEEGDLRPTGMHLADWYGDDYYVVGMEFNQGAFRAYGTGGVDEFVVDPAPAGTAPAILSRLDMPYAFVDMRAASEDDFLSEWLAGPEVWSSIGAAFDPDEEETYRFDEVVVPGRRFDGLLFVEETEPSRPV